MKSLFNTTKLRPTSTPVETHACTSCRHGIHHGAAGLGAHTVLLPYYSIYICDVYVHMQRVYTMCIYYMNACYHMVHCNPATTFSYLKHLSLSTFFEDGSHRACTRERCCRCSSQLRMHTCTHQYCISCLDGTSEQPDRTLRSQAFDEPSHHFKVFQHLLYNSICHEYCHEMPQ